MTRGQHLDQTFAANQVANADRSAEVAAGHRTAQIGVERQRQHADQYLPVFGLWQLGMAKSKVAGFGQTDRRALQRDLFDVHRQAAFSELLA